MSRPVGVRNGTLTIVRPREHPLSNYGTLVRFLPDRTCRSAINFATIRFRSIIRKLAVPFPNRRCTIMPQELNFSVASMHFSFLAHTLSTWHINEYFQAEELQRIIVNLERRISHRCPRGRIFKRPRCISVM